MKAAPPYDASRTIAGMFGGDCQSLLMAVCPPARELPQYCAVVTAALRGRIAKRASTSNIYEVVDLNIMNLYNFLYRTLYI